MRGGGGGSSGNTSNGAGRGSAAPNTGGGEQIVPIGQDSKRTRPEGILSAISTIQHYYLMEQDGDPVPGDFLTIEGIWDYFRLGFKSGFSEGLILFLFFPFMDFYIVPFVIKDPTTATKAFFYAIPYSLIAFNTLLCFYIARFYIGNITRKAINSLFSGRMLGLLVKAVATYTLWFTVIGISQYSKYVWWFSEKLALFRIDPLAFYNGFYYIQPKIMITANRATLLLVIAALGPYGIAWLYDWWRQIREARIKRILQG